MEGRLATASGWAGGEKVEVETPEPSPPEIRSRRTDTTPTDESGGTGEVGVGATGRVHVNIPVLTSCCSLKMSPLVRNVQGVSPCHVSELHVNLRLSRQRISVTHTHTEWTRFPTSALVQATSISPWTVPAAPTSYPAPVHTQRRMRGRACLRVVHGGGRTCTGPTTCSILSLHLYL